MLLWFHFNKLMTMSTKYGITKIHFASVLLVALSRQQESHSKKENKQSVPMYIYSLIYTDSITHN